MLNFFCNKPLDKYLYNSVHEYAIIIRVIFMKTQHFIIFTEISTLCINSYNFCFVLTISYNIHNDYKLHIIFDRWHFQRQFTIKYIFSKIINCIIHYARVYYKLL
jgi:hypothetical protein